MELRQLAYFAAVAREGSFTRAAERLLVAQPGVSAQVRKLEAELGEELLDRSGRRVRLTAAGAAVLPHAQAALDAVAALRQTIDELSGLVRGQVAVGVVTSWSGVDMPALLAGFHRAHPQVEITLAEEASEALLDGVRSGRLDLAVLGVAGPLPDGVDSLTIADQPFVAAVALDDPLAARMTMPLRALRERTLICLPRGTGMRAALDAGCARAGFAPRIGFEASDPDAVAQLAGRGLGVAILPASLAAAHPAGLHAVGLTRPRLRGRMVLVWRAAGPHGPAARALIAHAREELGAPPE